MKHLQTSLSRFTVTNGGSDGVVAAAGGGGRGRINVQPRSRRVKAVTGRLDGIRGIIR